MIADPSIGPGGVGIPGQDIAPTEASPQSKVGHDSSDRERGAEPQNTGRAGTAQRPGPWRNVYSALTWTPPSCRWDEANPPKFTMSQNAVYAAVTMLTVANLYWNQPILNKIAEAFDVSYERASSVATLMQAGYAGGLLFICPAGDMVKRRPFILSIIFVTALMWIGLCVTKSFAVFSALSFLCGFTTVTPQMMLPLVGDFAPAHRRASSISLVVSGLMLGMLVARLLSGIISNYTDWRNIYWLAFGAQIVVVVFLFFLMPDYPSTNPNGTVVYWTVFRDMARLVVTQPLIVQACVVGFGISAVFTSFWTTLTYLLASPPYEYTSVVIGLFALIGIVAIGGGPVYGRLVTDKISPWYSSVIGISVAMVGIAASTGIGSFTVAGPILHALAIDLGLQLAQVANRAAIFGIDPKARNRINTAYMLASFCGQLTGTAVGNRLYAQGGWRLSSGCSLAFTAFALLAMAVKGPRSQGWISWGGSWRVRNDAVLNKKPAAATDPEEGRGDDEGSEGVTSKEETV